MKLSEYCDSLYLKLRVQDREISIKLQGKIEIGNQILYNKVFSTRHNTIIHKTNFTEELCYVCLLWRKQYFSWNNFQILKRKTLDFVSCCALQGSIFENIKGRLHCQS